MTANVRQTTQRGFPWRALGWGGAVVLLSLPLILGAPWTLSDYVFAAVLFGTVGIAFELIARKSPSLAYKAGAAFGVIGALLTVWVNGAVGMIASEDNPYNLLFLGVPLLALLGSILARFRSAGMALAMLVAGIAQAALGANGLVADFRGGVFSIIFAGIWLLAAALFHVGRREAPTPA